MTTNNALDITSQGQVYYDGAGTFTAPSITQYAPVIGDVSNKITSTAALTNGQLLIGSTGAAPVPASIMAGTNITITPGAGSIVISSAAGGVVWTTTSVSVANMNTNTGYFVSGGSGVVTLGLPATANRGDIVRVSSIGAATWQITQSIGQQIFIGVASTTFGLTGSLSSTQMGDSVELVCSVPNLSWVVQSSMGNIGII